jgi:hypothetical protein
VGVILLTGQMRKCDTAGGRLAATVSAHLPTGSEYFIKRPKQAYLIAKSESTGNLNWKSDSVFFY